ncbi:MAG: hypothetical protein VX528_17565 [Candidatus Latescibacterota bacterium]|nr:hypothetical protein [Candidatus Latescibacterota bacterium]
MSESLQSAFIRTRGGPVEVGDYVVTQGDYVPITRGVVYITFVRGLTIHQGVALSVKGGWVQVSDGSKAKKLQVWRDPQFPDWVQHRVYCPKGELLIYNIYRRFDEAGRVFEEMWTRNAGMTILESEEGRRVYGCSDGEGPFDPEDLVVEVQWREDDGSEAGG